MTNEEALEILEHNWTGLSNPDCTEKELCEALDLAIKALEQQPCDDCISRQAVINTIFYKADNNCEVVLSTDLMDRIKHLPSVTPQPKTGHWIFCEGIKGKDNVEKCSCCQSHWKEAVIYRSDTQEYLRIRLLFCPNCGAKMVEPQESEGEE